MTCSGEQPVAIAEYVVFCEKCGFVGCDLCCLESRICPRCKLRRSLEDDQEGN